MKTRPKLLTLLSLFLFAVCFSFPLQTMAFFGELPPDLRSALANLAPMNRVVMGISGVTAYLALRGSTSLLVLLPLLSAAVIYNNWIVASASLNYSPWAAWSAGLACAAVLCYPLFRPEIRKILFAPSLRWWLTPTRYSLAVPLRLKLMRSVGKKPHHNPIEFKAKTFDISEGGAFIPYDFIQPMGADSSGERTFDGEIEPGHQCFVTLTLGGRDYFSCRAEIVRSTQNNGRYPAGIGIRFLGLSLHDEWSLGSYLRENSRPIETTQ